MKRSLLALAVVASLSLAACTTTPGGGFGSVNPDKAKTLVYQAEGTYRTALIAATTYRELPRCSATVKLPCAEPKIVQQLQKAALVARSAIDSAESVAYTPGLGANAALDAATAAMATAQALSSATATLGVK